MIDFASLRPTDNSPQAIAAAMDRCSAAGRDALAKLEPLKARHAALLLSGRPSRELDEVDAELQRATEDAIQIGQLMSEVRRELDKATVASVVSLALMEMADWVSQNSEVLVQGMYLLGGLSRALTPQPPVPVPPVPTSNVVSMTRPGAV